MIQEFKQNVGVWNGSEFVLENITEKHRIEMIRDLTKVPGEIQFDERIFKFLKTREHFEKHGYYTNLVSHSRDWVSFWEHEKSLLYSGVRIGDFYISGDTYNYLNFNKIPNKVDGGRTFPWFLDTDVWYLNNIELAPLLNKFTVTVKKRQIGISLKHCSKMLKRFYHEDAYVGRLASYNESYVRENWKIMSDYHDFMQTNTAWKRPLDPGKTLNWRQRLKMPDNTYRGRKSTLKGVTTKTNPAALVSGTVSEVWKDEVGIDATLGESVEFASPALSWGDKITGEMHLTGAVGKLKDSKDLKELFYNPEKHNMLAFENTYDNNSKKIGIFIPEQWSYGSFIDKYGNSDVPGALNKIEELAEKEKGKSYKAYMIYKSQRPTTPGDAFAERTENDFPIHIIEPHYNKLVADYNPMTVELYRDNRGRLKHTFSTKYPIVKDFPVKRDTFKHGAIVIDEMPVPNPPFGLYYAGVDTISPIMVSNSAVSLQSIYIYKSEHSLDGEYSSQKPVAWYAGRPDERYGAYEITKNLINFYNSRAAIENDNKNCIEWMINQKQQKYMMRRRDFMLAKDVVAKSSISMVEYGLRTGNAGMKNYLISLAIEYVTEILGHRTNPETGESEPIYGVERINDEMLLREMLDYTPKKNVDRCFPPNEPVRTNKGIKPIKDIQLGDLVLTHKGRYKEVNELINNPYKGTNYRIKAMGIEDTIECTPNHPFYTAWSTTPTGKKPYGKYWKYKWTLNHKEWVNAKDLTKGKYLLLPSRKDLKQTSFSWFEMYLLGWYLSDGYISNTQKQVRISFQGNQRYIAEFIKQELLKYDSFSPKVVKSTLTGKNVYKGYKEPSIKKVPNKYCYNLTFTSDKFVELLDKTTYWKDAKDLNYKTLKENFYNSSGLLPLVLGVFEGDGHQKNTNYNGTKRSTLEMSLINKELIYQIKQILLDEGIWGTVSYDKGNMVRRRGKLQWRIDIQDWEGINRLVQDSKKFTKVEITRKQKKSYIKKEEGYWVPITSIEKVNYEGEVYNLEVQDDHSYTVKGVATHNCVSFAIALFASRSNTNRGFKLTSKAKEYKKPVKQLNHHFKRTYNSPFQKS